MMDTYLYDSLLSLDLKNLTLSDDTVSESNIDNLCILGELDVIQDDQWTLDIEHRSVVDTWRDVVVTSCSCDLVSN